VVFLPRAVICRDFLCVILHEYLTFSEHKLQFTLRFQDTKSSSTNLLLRISRALLLIRSAVSMRVLVL